MLGIKKEEVSDLTSRLQQLAKLDRPALVAPRRPLDDVPVAPLVPWVMGDVVSGGGRMYVLGTKDGPGFARATWLRQGTRPTA